VPKALEHPPGLPNAAHALGCYAEKSLRAASAYGRGVAQSRGNQAFLFEALQCGIDAAESSFAPASFLDFVTDGDAVCVVSETDQREEHHQFELAEIWASGHLFNYTE
jgi:hypothetical protein